MIADDAGRTETPWPPVIALAFGQLVAWGILYYGFAVIAGPMGAETGWSKSAMNGALSLGLCISGLCAYFVGRWIDHYGGRGIMAMGAALGALGLVLWSQVTALWQLYAVWALIGLATSMTLYEAAFAVVARLVPQNYRQGITAITLVAGLASTIFIPTIDWLVEHIGWRNALLVLAALELVICVAVPLSALPRSHRPQRRSASAPASDRWALLHAVRREPVFWLLVTSYVAHGFFYTSILFSLLPLLDARGYSPAAAIGLYALIGPAQVAGRLALFSVSRVVPTALAGLIATLLPVAAMLVFMVTQTDSLLVFAFPVLFGAGMGIKTVIQATAAPEFLRQNAYGALQGLITFPVLMAQAAAPFAAALVWEIAGGPDVLIAVLFAFSVLSAAAFLLAARLAAVRPAPVLCNSQ